MTNFPLIIYTLVPAGSFLTAFFLLRWMLASCAARFAMDKPNNRSLHLLPVPRIGGLALMAGALVGWVLALQADLVAVLLFAGGLVVVSFWDDVRGLGARWRLLVHLISAVGFVACLLPGVPPLPTVLAVLATAWMTNLYNFMDGCDGLAGGMAAFGFSFYALGAGLSGDTGLALASLSIAMAALAFLMFNFRPAKVFLGDAGSIPLGFLAAAIGLLGWHRQLWPIWFPVLVFSSFITDASVTLGRRILCGDQVTQAHKEHYYQRIVRMGWGHRQTALCEYALMLSAGACAIWGLRQKAPYQVLLLVMWGVVYLVLMYLIDKLWLEHRSANATEA
ncbi:MAG: glycosyltransferase family 4 protein [Burkholderiales bacterium]